MPPGSAWPGSHSPRLTTLCFATRTVPRALPAMLCAVPRAASFAQEFLVLGYSLLLSDVDILTLQNPFDHLHRDEDVEGLSDGFDPQTAYGGWSVSTGG